MRRAMKRGKEAKRGLGPISRKGLSRRVLGTRGGGKRSQDRVSGGGQCTPHLLANRPHPHNNTLPLPPFPCNPLVC